MKKTFVLLLFVIFSLVLNAQNNSSNKIDKFFKTYPCMESFVKNGTAQIHLDNKGFAVLIIPKTGIHSYDNTGGLGFYDFGIAYKVGHPKSTGTWTCKGQYKLKGSDGTNTETILSTIEILWQTDANGYALSTASGLKERNDCNSKPLPHEIGCYSAEISEVQVCIPGLKPDGVLGKKTVEKLESLGYDMSQGLTQEIYDEIMVKCGRIPAK